MIALPDLPSGSWRETPDMSLPPRPLCRCAERREALERARAATLRGDPVAAKIEYDFVARTLKEDGKLLLKWALFVKQATGNKQ